MNNIHSAYVSGVLGGIMGSTIVGGILALVLSTVPAKASPVVGYVQVTPDDCQVEYLAEDNQIYTFWEDCDEN